MLPANEHGEIFACILLKKEQGLLLSEIQLFKELAARQLTAEPLTKYLFQNCFKAGFNSGFISRCK